MTAAESAHAPISPYPADQTYRSDLLSMGSIFDFDVSAFDATSAAVASARGMYLNYGRPQRRDAIDDGELTEEATDSIADFLLASALLYIASIARSGSCDARIQISAEGGGDFLKLESREDVRDGKLIISIKDFLATPDVTWDFTGRCFEAMDALGPALASKVEGRGFEVATRRGACSGVRGKYSPFFDIDVMWGGNLHKYEHCICIPEHIAAIGKKVPVDDIFVGAKALEIMYVERVERFAADGESANSKENM